SVKTGGLYDGIARGRFVPEFEAVAFRLKVNEVSEIFESAFGYHFIQLIARRGELVDVRHILVTAKVTTQDIMDAKVALDSIYQHIQDGKIDFCTACAKFSDEKETKNNCGAMLNQAAGSTKFEIEELGQVDQNLVFMLDKMKPGEISKPLVNQGQQGQDTKQSFRIIYLKTRSEPHRANLKDDYQRMQGMAQVHKQKSVVDAWVNKKLRSIYVRIDDDYKNCKFTHNWKQASNP
ncbi:MAG TPA: peptidylprolyl isomerase, partial [Bacteroidia bacterium]|nr:peptidylprolyl isomerase [Bacteroidia bacterium]